MRVLFVFVHKEKCTLLVDIQTVYDKICEPFKRRTLPISELWWDNDPQSLRVELLKYGNTKARGELAEACPINDWESCLTECEMHNLVDYKLGWRKKMGTDANTDPNAVFVLSQSPENHWSSSRKDGSFPTILKTSSQRKWSPARRRWHTCKESGSLMGWPTRPDLAEAIGLPLVPCDAIHHFHELLGDGQHLPNMGIAILSILTSIQFTMPAVPPPLPPPPLPPPPPAPAHPAQPGWDDLPGFMKADNRGAGTLNVKHPFCKDICAKFPVKVYGDKGNARAAAETWFQDMSNREVSFVYYI